MACDLQKVETVPDRARCSRTELVFFEQFQKKGIAALHIDTQGG